MLGVYITGIVGAAVTMIYPIMNRPLDDTQAIIAFITAAFFGLLSALAHVASLIKDKL